MAHKKHKLIALATSSVLVTATLVGAGAILSTNIKANAGKLKSSKNSANADPTPIDRSKFKWSSDNTTITGFAAGTTTAEIEGYIDSDNRLVLPECEYIAKGAFDFDFDKVSKEFTLVLHKNVKEVGESAFMGNAKIIGLAFHDGSAITTSTKLQTIGMCAFEKTGLTSIAIPNGCIIGERAFYKCKKLESIDLGDRSSLYTDIGSHAFQGIKDTGVLKAGSMSSETANAMAANFTTTAWASLKFASTATAGRWTLNSKAGTAIPVTNTIPTLFLDIDKDTKELKAGLKRGSLSDYDTLYVPKEVKTLGANAFADVTTLKTLNFADNSECKTIGNNCFAYCENLEGDLKLPASLREIGRQAFINCDKITSLDMSAIHFGGSSRSFAIGTEAFKGWDSSQKHTITYPTQESTTGMTVDQIKGLFKIQLGTTGELNDKWLDSGIVQPSAEEYAAATETRKVQVEGDEDYEYEIVSVDWSAVKTEGVNTYAFQPSGDGKKQTVVSDLFWDGGQSTLPPNIQTIDMSNADIKNIGDNAFRGSSITTVILSDSTETIGEGTFQDCTNLSGVALPSALTSIGARAFAGCDNAYYLDLSKLTNAQLLELIERQNNGEEVIGEEAFKGYGQLCTNGGTILWANDVKETTKDAFLTILQQIGKLPENFNKEVIDGEGTAGGIPTTNPINNKVILVIEDNVLKKINWENLEEYITQIEDEKGTAISSLPLIIPRNVTSIATDFWPNSISGKTTTSIAKINRLSFAIGSKCTYIGTRAFSGAGNFKGSLTIPEGVTTIDTYAFQGCSGFDGALKLPKSINVSYGIKASAFNGMKNMQALDVSSWDNEYIEQWTDTLHPFGGSIFYNWYSKAMLVPYAAITGDNLTMLQNKLKNPAQFPSSQFGQDVTGYDTTQHGQLEATEFETEDKLRLIDTVENKDALAEMYIDTINKASVTLKKGTTTETISGLDILKHDLLTTFSQANIDNPGLASKDPVINVNLSNVSVVADKISFDVVANLNVYSSMYSMGITAQFATSVKNLHIVSSTSFSRTRKNQMTKQIGIEFTVDTDTEFVTEYDRESMYSWDAQGNYKETPLINVTNTSFSFAELASEFDPEATYLASSSSGTKLHTLARQAYAAAPGLFGELFGVYDNTSLVGLTDGRDSNGMLYTPYIQSSKNEFEELTYKYLPLKGKIASPTFGEFAAYDLSDNIETQVYEGLKYSNSAWNYTNNTIQHDAATLKTSEVLALYKTWLQDTTTYGTSLESGRLLKEDYAYSSCSAAQTYINTLLATNKYTRVESDTFDFYQLKEDGKMLPVLSVDQDTGDLLATFGIDTHLVLHDDEFIFNGNPPSGTEKIDGYKHSFEIHLSLIFRNVRLYNISYTEKNKLSLWSISDNIESKKDKSSFTIGTGTYLRTLEYDDTPGVQKFTTAYTLADMPDTYTYEEIKNGKGTMPGISKFTTLDELEEHMAKYWPLLYNLNVIRPGTDDAGNLYVALDFSSWYLKNITLK